MARSPKMSSSGVIMHRVKLGWSSIIAMRTRGMISLGFAALMAASCLTYNPADPSFNTSTSEAASNLMGRLGATLSDTAIQTLGISAWVWVAVMMSFGLQRTLAADPRAGRRQVMIRLAIATLGIILLAGALAGPPAPRIWPLATGLGGMLGEVLLQLVAWPFRAIHLGWTRGTASLLLLGLSIPVLMFGFSLAPSKIMSALLEAEARLRPVLDRALALLPQRVVIAAAPEPTRRRSQRKDASMDSVRAAEPEVQSADDTVTVGDHPDLSRALAPELSIKTPKPVQRDSGREEREKQKTFEFGKPGGFVLPELAMLAKAPPRQSAIDEEALRQNAKLLESVLFEFGVKGAIDQIRPGPVVTLYELVPAPGVKHARVVSLSDDIARSMSVAACRVSVVQGRNAIGIELPNVRRETVYLRDLLGSQDYEKAAQNLPMALGETIGGDPYIADLARMPHLLIAGTTGSGKSVGVNAMILSILYRLPPSECRFIMIDPKMLELSVYDGIPHLLAPVVTDPKKAIVALKWTVREMEDRYRRMSKIGVRNIGGFNDRAREALAKGEMFERTVQTGFDEGGQPIFETEQLHPATMPYLVVVIDEVADLMMVAGKDIEAAVQRLAQMARAAGIHLIMATQRPSVDVITGTIKANFPTRISFQVTSKIDSRTIMGEQGAEQLLGQGDMLYMAGGGRITRLHGPFVSDAEVETVAGFLREQGEPQYLEEVTATLDSDDDGGSGVTQESVGNDLYDHAVAIVVRDRKASTSYVQRRLQIGYNRAASLIERMEQEGVVTAANHAGKRDILVPPPGH